MLETTVDMVQGEKFCIFYTNVPKYIKVVQSYLQTHPDDVYLMYDETDKEEGGIEVKCPSKWFKIPKPPRQMSEENRAKAAERLRNLKNKTED